jgi:hypothetical protein
MQLVAYGAQDIYLTGNPQITFFKVVYRRHTNFSMEAIQQTFDGTTGFGNTVSATISRNGDLVHRMYLEHTATFRHADDTADDGVGLVERYGDSLIKECEIEIGGQRIDKHTSMWNRVWSDLTELNPSGYFGSTSPDDDGTAVANNNNGTLYQLMSGNGYGWNSDGPTSTNVFGVTSTQSINGFTYTAGSAADNIDIGRIFLPLNFWFCRNPGLALPLIALQYHEVKIKMTFEALSNLAATAAGAEFTTVSAGEVGAGKLETPSTSFDLWCDYIYLDTDERRRFAQVSHEYLIEQLQYSDNTISDQSPSIKLNFNHPVKELIWCTRNETVGGATADGGRNQAFAATKGDYTAGPVSLDTMGGNWQLKLNGHDRFAARDSRYFTRTQVWQHHTGYGSLPTEGIDDAGNVPDGVHTVGNDAIAVYSFALKPEEHQPSGTCNFSRIDNAKLVGTSITVDASANGSANGYSLTSCADGDANNTKLTIFAVNYNVLRIMSGMGGLAYSN